MNNLFQCLSLLVIIFSCSSSPSEQAKDGEVPVSFSTSIIEGNIDQPLERIAIGSCNRQNEPQTMWAYILENDPQLWIWLGDNIYGDSEDMAVLERKYQQQLAHPEYQALQAHCPIIGIWDDHDYGVNDGDKRYSKKAESKALMMDFLNVPADAAVRKRPGAYQSYSYGPDNQKVKVILLDGRSFRDELDRPRVNGKRQYVPNEEGDMLGEEQWAWLRRELTDSDAQVHLIGCGVQFLPEDHIYEKWANFPSARQRLFDLLTELAVERPILMSGDRHIAEISAIALDGFDQKVFEITASGLTHSWETADEENRHRIGPLVTQKNFGVITIDWTNTKPQVRLSVRGQRNELYHQVVVSD